MGAPIYSATIIRSSSLDAAGTLEAFHLDGPRCLLKGWALREILASGRVELKTTHCMAACLGICLTKERTTPPIARPVH